MATKPSFRSAFKKRRCLVAADGFYEWMQDGKRKRPHLFRRRDGKPFAFAGLWERWQDAEGVPLETCSLITTDANGVVAPVHNRMPVILDGAKAERWLQPGELDAEADGRVAGPSTGRFPHRLRGQHARQQPEVR